MSKIFEYISELIPIIVICFSILYGLKEKINIFEYFKSGVYNGIKIVYKIFPVLLGLFIATSILNSSQILKIIGNLFEKIFFPEEIFSLIFVRCISGSAAIASVDGIFSKYGVDSIYSRFASILLGSTETTIYAIMMYSSCFKDKKYKIYPLIILGLMGDLCAIFLSFLWVKKIFL